MSAPVKIEEVVAKLKAMGEGARERIRAAAARGDPAAIRILREWGEEPPAPHWQEKAEREPGEDDVP